MFLWVDLEKKGKERGKIGDLVKYIPGGTMSYCFCFYSSKLRSCVRHGFSALACPAEYLEYIYTNSEAKGVDISRHK